MRIFQLLGRQGNLDLAPNSHNQFNRKCVADSCEELTIKPWELKS